MSETASQHADDVLGLFWLSEHYTPEAWATAVIADEFSAQYRGARESLESLDRADSLDIDRIVDVLEPIIARSVAEGRTLASMAEQEL